MAKSNKQIDTFTRDFNQKMNESIKKKMKRHPDTYMVFGYVCDRCGKHELIWNSRDGVTPFMVRCNVSGCTGSAQHIDWEKDKYDPYYVPLVGERIFITGTPEIVRPDFEKYVEKQWSVGKYPLCRHYASKEEAINELIKNAYIDKPGQPFILTITEENKGEYGKEAK